MRGMFEKQVVALILMIPLGLLSGCERIKANLPQESTSSSSSSSSVTYTCYDYSNGEKYNSLLACQTATGAQCASSLESFPNGSFSTCYTPMATDCLQNVPYWEYTVYTVTGISSTGYELTRSLIGCSRNECICTGAVDLTDSISTLPVGCSTSSCGPYIYMGNLALVDLNFTLSVNAIGTSTPVVSADTSVTMNLSAGPPNQVLKLYDNPTCFGTPLNGAAGTTLSASGGASISGLSVTGGA